MRFKQLLRHPLTFDLLLALAAAYAVKLFISEVDAHYPVKYWLFWRYAGSWALSAFWSASIVTAGHGALKLLRRRVMPWGEQLALSAGAGVMLFFLAMFVGGLLKLFGSVFFVALPLLLLLAGARPTFRYLRRFRRHLLAARRRGVRATHWWVRPLVAFGFLSLVAVYLPLLLPENVSYDSRWYHMALAEQYATVGGIFPYREGWLLGAYPHLASFIYSWAFQMPGGSLFDHVELAAHLELAVFLLTLAAIPALVRALLPGARAPRAWVALFLFPGILIYDSSLNGGADHIAAFWAIPIYLSLLRFWRSTSVVDAALFACMVAGALDTKYSAVAIVAGPLAAFGLRLGLSLLPTYSQGRWKRPRPAWLAAAGALGVVLTLTAPHWAKNWIWYGDPVYPLLRGKLASHPWSAEATRQFEALQTAAWRAPHNLVGLKESFKVLALFSFEPHDWETMHGKVPVFGSLFTLTALLLPFVWRKRVWGIYFCTHLCVFVWFWVQHEDRYLQGLVPLMAAATASVLVYVWTQRGYVARSAVGALVGLQVIWGGDIFFFPAHQMLGGSPLRALIDHISSGFRKEYSQRVEPYPGYAAIRKELDARDVLLIHEDHVQLGIGVHTVQDGAGFQGGLYYTDSASPAALAKKLRAFGVTHVLSRRSSLQSSSVAEDLVFFDFVARHTTDARRVSGYELSKLSPNVTDERPFGDVVGFYGCRSVDDFAYAPGLYHLRQLNITYLERHPRIPRPFEPASTPAQLERQLARTDFVVINHSCHPGVSPLLKAGFVSIGSLRQLEYWVKQTSP